MLEAHINLYRHIFFVPENFNAPENNLVIIKINFKSSKMILNRRTNLIKFSMKFYTYTKDKPYS